MAGVLIRQAGGTWQPPATSAYADEKELKLLLKDMPGLLWNETAVVDEFWIPGAGSVDLLGVGLDGSITLVECKLKKNPEIRREVVGQVLAYAGGLWRTPYEDFAGRYAGRAGMSLVEHLEKKTQQQVVDPDALRAAIHTRLSTGSFRLVIAVDEITEELKFVVEWLNGHTAPGVEVIALEADYAKDNGVEVLVPRFYGETVKKSPAVTKQTETDIVKQIEALPDPATRDVLERLLAHGHEKGHHSAPGTSGMSYWYVINKRPTSVWAMWPKEAPPTLSVSIGSIHAGDPARAMQFLIRLRENSTLSAFLPQPKPDEMKKFPTVPIAGVLTSPGVLDHLLVAIEDSLLN
jgi:hypothetical protein